MYDDPVNNTKEILTKSPKNGIIPRSTYGGWGTIKFSSGDNMSLGTRWRETLSQSGINVGETASDRYNRELSEAAVITASIPALLEKAFEEKTICVQITRGVRDDDVSELHNESVDALWRIRYQKNLRERDLAGRALWIFHWCTENGLACYLTQETRGMDHSYSLNIRPL